jgi:hypothetical protein
LQAACTGRADQGPYATPPGLSAFLFVIASPPEQASLFISVINKQKQSCLSFEDGLSQSQACLLDVSLACGTCRSVLTPFEL